MTAAVPAMGAQPETGAESMTEAEFTALTSGFEHEVTALTSGFEHEVTKLRRRFVHAAAILLLTILVVGTITTAAPVIL